MAMPRFHIPLPLVSPAVADEPWVNGFGGCTVGQCNGSRISAKLKLPSW